MKIDRAEYIEAALFWLDGDTKRPALAMWKRSGATSLYRHSDDGWAEMKQDDPADQKLAAVIIERLNHDDIN